MKHMNIVRIPKDEYLETEDARPPAFSDEALALRFHRATRQRATLCRGLVALAVLGR